MASSDANYIDLTKQLEHQHQEQQNNNSSSSSSSKGHRRTYSKMQALAGNHGRLAMGLCSRVSKVLFLIGFSIMFTAVYVNVFQHPPPDVLLAMNGKGQTNYGEDSGAHSRGRKAKTAVESGDEDEDQDDVGETIGKRSAGRGSGSGVVKFADYWEDFVKRNHFVSIGAVYDSCENWSAQIGAVIMLQDKEFGGVKSRTFVNLTLDKEIDGGQFNVEVQYNGKDLYDNYWEVCELEEELPPKERTFNCPVAAGKHIKVKDRHIPNYLPKGRYHAKAWAADEDEKVIACGYSDFTI